MTQKKEANERIRTNILKFGHHVYLVQQHVVPRFAYTIGLSRAGCHELLFPGASYFMADEVMKIIDEAATSLRRNHTSRLFSVAPFGQFALREVDESWAISLMLGAADFFGHEGFRALQIIPEKPFTTIDVPDCSVSIDQGFEPVWQWIKCDWQYSVPSQSVAVTNLDALRGRPVTEAVRWEEDEWELFAGAGPEVDREDVRIVPLGTLIAADRTIEAVVQLSVGAGLWREGGDDDWHSWERRST